MTTFLWICAAYLIGAIPTGVLLTRCVGTDDIRTKGSGNIGATNVYRVAGRKLGLITLLGDCLKGLLPVLVVKLCGYDAGLTALVALSAFLGHCYPIYLGFKGGKGVATALGVFLVLSPTAVLCAFAVFALVLWKWRFISLSSITAAAITPIVILFANDSWAIFFVALIIAAIVIWRHKGNIERLLQGNENRFNL